MPDQNVLTPIICPQCQAHFLPHSADVAVVTSCPQCHHHATIGECAPAPAQELSVMKHVLSAQEIQELEHARQLRITTILGVLIMGCAVTLVWRLWPKESRSSAPPAAEFGGPAVEKQEILDAYATAKAALESHNWQGMLLHVLDQDRVRPLMEWYYAHREGGFTLREISGFDEEIIDLQQQPATASMRLSSNGTALHTVLQKTSTGWKLDWESYSSVHSVRWKYFLTQTPDIPQVIEVPVMVERFSPNRLFTAFYEASGYVPEETAGAVRCYLHDPADDAVACFAADSTIGRELLQECKGGNSAKFILKVKIRAVDSFPRAIEIQQILMQGWRSPLAPRATEK